MPWIVEPGEAGRHPSACTGFEGRGQLRRGPHRPGNLEEPLTSDHTEATTHPLSPNVVTHRAGERQPSRLRYARRLGPCLRCGRRVQNTSLCFPLGHGPWGFGACAVLSVPGWPGWRLVTGMRRVVRRGVSPAPHRNMTAGNTATPRSLLGRELAQQNAADSAVGSAAHRRHRLAGPPGGLNPPPTRHRMQQPGAARRSPTAPKPHLTRPRATPPGKVSTNALQPTGHLASRADLHGGIRSRTRRPMSKYSTALSRARKPWMLLSN